jgi:hypothetical protein
LHPDLAIASKLARTAIVDATAILGSEARRTEYTPARGLRTRVSGELNLIVQRLLFSYSERYEKQREASGLAVDRYGDRNAPPALDESFLDGELDEIAAERQTKPIDYSLDSFAASSSVDACVISGAAGYGKTSSVVCILDPVWTLLARLILNRRCDLDIDVSLSVLTPPVPA